MEFLSLNEREEVEREYQREYQLRLEEYYNIALEYLQINQNEVKNEVKEQQNEGKEVNEVSEVKEENLKSEGNENNEIISEKNERNEEIRENVLDEEGGEAEAEREEGEEGENQEENQDDKKKKKIEKYNSRRKHTFLTRSFHLGEVTDRLDLLYYCDMCEEVVHNAEKCDFVLIILIRLLFLLKMKGNQSRVNHIKSKLTDFSFWPTSKSRMKDVIFWSENHIFMYLSSAYLVFQEFGKECGATAQDKQHLLAYLNGHCHEEFSGVYEVLSVTYLPFTLCSLFNLYDFAEDPQVKAQSLFLINKIVCSFALVTNDSGICNLTASARQYSKTRLTNYGLNINQLMYILVGKTIDEKKPTSIVDFLLTTSWRPQYEVLHNFLLPLDGFIQYQPNAGYFETRRMNHGTKHTRKIYRYEKFSEENAVPFYW